VSESKCSWEHDGNHCIREADHVGDHIYQDDDGKLCRPSDEVVVDEPSGGVGPQENSGFVRQARERLAWGLSKGMGRKGTTGDALIAAAIFDLADAVREGSRLLARAMDLKEGRDG
jgi:hypothetical protein